MTEGERAEKPLCRRLFCSVGLKRAEASVSSAVCSREAELSYSFPRAFLELSTWARAA